MQLSVDQQVSHSARDSCPAVSTLTCWMHRVLYPVAFTRMHVAKPERMSTFTGKI